MASTHLQDAIQELHSPGADRSQQLTALKSLKNGIIGHPQKKEQLVRYGLIDGLRQVLGLHEKPEGRRDSEDAHGNDATRKPTTDVLLNEIRLQAIIIIGSLAYGSNSYVGPLNDNKLFVALYDALSPQANPPKIVVAALRSLLSVILAIGRDPEAEVSVYLQDLFDGHQYVEALGQILLQQKSSATFQNQIMLVGQLLSQAVSTEHQRTILAEAAIIESLASHISSYYFHDRFRGHRASASRAAQISPPSARTLPHLLGALSATIGTSQYRAARLLYFPPILRFFPFNYPMNGAERHHVGLPEEMLPWVHLGPQKQDTFSKAFPALGSIQPSMNNAGTLDTSDSYQVAMEATQSAWESSLLPWLVWHMRSEGGAGRVQAARLATTLIEAGFFHRSRERALALLAVPLLVTFLDDVCMTHENDILSSKTRLEEEDNRIRAVTVLATLMRLFPGIQKAAVDAGIIGKACTMLKRTFDYVECPECPLYLDDNEASSTTMVDVGHLGKPGLPLEIHNTFKCREAALLLIASIADREDKYRKTLTEKLVIPLIIQSLSELSDIELTKTLETRGPVKLDSSVGSPRPVIIAACDAARTMSRSVSLLRTCLIDAGLGTPCLRLLDHPEMEVLAAALDVIANIITEFSPIRALLISEGVVKKLCGHAHSAEPAIRLRALWALKHLLYRSPNEIKTECFNELGSGWLVQIITGAPSEADTSTSQLSTSQAPASRPTVSAAANAAGERIDILNSSADAMDTSDSTELPSATPASTTSFRAQQSQESPNFSSYKPIDRALLSALHTLALSAAAQQAASNNLQIQIQGLDFIRNLTQGPNAAAMIDMLFSAVDSSRLLELLSFKLAASSPSATSDSTTNVMTSNARSGAADTFASTVSTLEPQHQPPPLLQSTLYILVHLAASPLPRHRSLLTSHPTLIPTTLLPLTHHPSSAVRIAVVWIFVNLTWIDDANDRVGADQRGKRLRETGVAGRLREMMGAEGRGDESVDVRERAGVAFEGCSERRADGQGGGGGGRGAGGNGGGASLASLGLPGSMGLGRAR